jgi:D-3-phosphoglycerate dehydrogenase / 2-oxoglutarate reductase
MRAVFVDASPSLAAAFERLRGASDPPLAIHRDPDVTPDALPGVIGGAEIAIIDHTALPTAIALACPRLTDVVFLGTGARSYMNPEELAAARGIRVHIIKGYGDTAVAEMAFALMWAAAKGLSRMDVGIRAGQWLRTDGLQLTGRTVGILGFGGIGAEMARLCHGAGMRVLAWNRTPREAEGVAFVPLETLLAESDVLSVHLLLNDETRGFLSRARLAAMKPGAILVNTARGAVVDEMAMVSALEAGHLHAAGLDVFEREPLPDGHPLTRLPNVVLAAHSAFRTQEATDNLVAAALAHGRRIAAG